MNKNIIVTSLAIIILIGLITVGIKGENEVGLVKVGVIAPLSGPQGNIGEEIVNTIKLASTTNISISYEDDQCDGKKAISAYQKLKNEGVHIFNVNCSGSVLAIAPIAKQDGNVVITGYGGSSEIRKTGDEVIRFTPDSISIAEAMANYVSTSTIVGKVGLLYEEQDYAVSAAKILKEKLGNIIVAEERYNANDNSFKTQLSKLKAADIGTVLYIPTSDKTAQLVYKEMQLLKFPNKIIGDVNVCEYPFAPKEYGLKVVCFDFGFPVETGEYKNFLEEYKARYGKASNFNFNDALTYDIFVIIDSFSKNKVDNLVPDLKKFLLAGVHGKMADYNFTSDGEIAGGGSLKLIER